MTFNIQQTFDEQTTQRMQQLFESAFPPEERRSTDQWLALIEQGCVTCHVARYDGRFAGLLTEWEFDTFRYGEHFAIEPALRGQNIGAAMMQHVLSLSRKPFVLEVELPDTDIARRRIAFYNRIGFALCDKDYLQPPYNEGLTPVPLRLMEYGGQLTHTEFDNVVRTIHRIVYNQTDV